MAQAAGPRHQLHRARRRARALRPRGRQADAADQPRRRLRRRRHVHGVRRRVRHPRGAALGQGPGDRRRDGRRHRDPHVDDVGPEADRLLGRGSSAPTCSTPARRSTTPTRPRDGKFVSLGSLEPQFYAELHRSGSASTTTDLPAQMDRAGWADAARRASPTLFKTKTRDEWDAMLARARDACYAPVLTMTRGDRAPAHQGARRRSSSATASPSPRPRRASRARRPKCSARAPWPGQHTDEALADWGFDAARSPSCARPARVALTRRRSAVGRATTASTASSCGASAPRRPR